LHLVQDSSRRRTIVLAGVCDGHLGRAASAFVRDKLPDAFAQELLAQPDAEDIRTALEGAWNQVCDDYRFECQQDTCSAEYDPREGVLLANTGSIDYVAGTTATVLAVDLSSSHLSLLNCGDSRAVVVRKDSSVAFQTSDHSPRDELERFARGREQGLGYGAPFCLLSRWLVPVGDYNYAVSRSLEGSFATSKGIVSTPDMSRIRAEPGMGVVVATDGLWEVIDSEEVGRIVTQLRFKQDMSAGDAARKLCRLALERGSKDNVSVVVLYLET
jgi:protein phosphatase PTC1